jgi:hypothetical protein
MLEATLKNEETLDSPPAWRNAGDSYASVCPATLLAGLEHLQYASAGCQRMGQSAAFVTQCAFWARKLFAAPLAGYRGRQRANPPV